jgi:pyridinium-3,5-biscarboxylic acid mononucleotide sulfurtransferase
MSEQSVMERLAATLERTPRRVIACSGGVDSLLLADIAHELRPGTTIVAHSVSPAVPPSATERVQQVAAALGWRLEVVESHEFEDRNYLANPRNRCYFCKSNLYKELDRVSSASRWRGKTWTVLSGANTDDLGEYRPGLIAAREHQVRHPFVEAGLAKADIRMLARERDREWHALPAAPCLASRLYTGTAVTPAVLRAVDAGEQMLRRMTRIDVVRCRIKDDDVIVEVAAEAREQVTPAMLSEVLTTMRREASRLRSITLDDAPYAPGRAFLALSPAASSTS